MHSTIAKKLKQKEKNADNYVDGVDKEGGKIRDTLSKYNP